MTQTTTSTQNTHEAGITDHDLKYRLSNAGIDFSHEDAWERLREHVAVHQYLLERQVERSMAPADGFASWRINVLDPIAEAIDRRSIRGAFPRMSNGDLYLGVSDHWYYLKQTNPGVSAAEAAEDYARKYGSALARVLYRLVPQRTSRGFSQGLLRADIIGDNIARRKNEIYSDPRNWSIGTWGA